MKSVPEHLFLNSVDGADGFAVQTYLELDKLVDQAEDEGIRARWGFGRVMLAERNGKKMPSGRLDAIARACGKSRSELQYRMRFAERYPTEDGLLNAVQQYHSWHQIVEEAFARDDPELEVNRVLDLRTVDTTEQQETTERPPDAVTDWNPAVDNYPSPWVVPPPAAPRRTYTDVLDGPCPHCGVNITVQVEYHPGQDAFTVVFLPPGAEEGKDFYP